VSLTLIAHLGVVVYRVMGPFGKIERRSLQS
jgi:hypothetical protein